MIPPRPQKPRNKWKELIWSKPEFLRPYDHPIREFPFYVDVEPTNHCNFSCIMCNREIMGRGQGRISLDTNKRIVDEAAQYAHLGVGIRYLRHGEPALHTDLPEMIAYAKSKGVLTYISTNGYNLDQMGPKLLDAGLDYLRVSMQGIDFATFTEIRDKEFTGKYFRVMSNVFDFAHQRFKRGAKCQTYFCLGTTCTYETPEQQERFRAFWSDVVDEVQVGITTFSRLEDVQEDVKEFVSRTKYDESLIRFHAPCTEVRTKLSVNWNGEVTACCSDQDGNLLVEGATAPSGVANVNQGDGVLRAAWRSKFLAELRDQVGPALRHKERIPCNVCYRENITSKFDYDEMREGEPA